MMEPNITPPPVVPPPPPPRTRETCSICAELHNKTTRLKIHCPYCNFDSCRLCCQKYILQESVAKCMNPGCAKELTRKHVRSLFTHTFVNKDYKTLREKVLLDLERALLPATQPIVERKLLQTRLNDEIERTNEEIRVMTRPLRRRIEQLRKELNQTYAPTDAAERALRSAAFVRACPDPECRGFLSTQWKCGLCEKWTCPTCHEIRGYQRDAPHECDPGNVATATLLNHDTKPCPKCGIGIFKVDGCDQMWCTLCHCAFNWRTGHIENNIHNPHYYEWLRRNGGGEMDRDPNDVPCGRVITHQYSQRVNTLLSQRISDKTLCDTVKRKVSVVTRAIIHIRVVILANYQVDHVLCNQDLRVKYLSNTMTEDEFKVQLQRRDKHHQKKREIHQVLHMMVNAVTDILYRFREELEKFEFNSAVPLHILNEVDPMFAYVNECLRDISVTFGSRMLQIDDRYDLVGMAAARPEAVVTNT